MDQGDINNQDLEATLLAGQQAKYFLHDVSNYLTVVNTAVELFPFILQGKIDPKTSTEVVSKCRRGLSELNSLCYTYRQAILGKYELNMEKQNFGVLFKTALEIVKDTYPKANLRLTYLVPEDHEITVDRTIFLQCLVNILKNAVENQYEGNQQIKIELMGDSIKIANPITLVKPASHRVKIGAKFLAKSLEEMNIANVIHKSKKTYVVIMKPN